MDILLDTSMLAVGWDPDVSALLVTGHRLGLLPPGFKEAVEAG